MPIRLQSVTPRVGGMSASLAAFSPNFDGTSADPTTYTGTLNAALASASASLSGNFVSNSDRAGTIGVSLAGVTGAFSDSSDPYNLGSLPSFVSSISWPSLPSTTRNVSVSSASSFNTEAAVSGTRVTITSSFTGSITVNASNVDVVCNSGVTVTGSLNFGSGSSGRISRVRWTGGTVIGEITNDNCNDLLIDNIHGHISGSGATNTYGAVDFERVALINSTLEATNGTSAGGWTWYSQQVSGGDETRGTDLIVANCRFESETQLVRIQATNRVVWIDSYHNYNNASANSIRYHHMVQNLYMRDCVTVGPNVPSTGETQVSTGLLDNVVRYHTLNNHFNGLAVETSNVGIINCDCFTTASGQIGGEVSVGSSTGVNGTSSGNNIIQSWDGSTLPNPATWRNNTLGKAGPMGADH